MNVLRKFLWQFDIFAAPATFRNKEEPEMKTSSIGAISILIIIGFSYVFISNLVQLFSFDKVSYSQTTRVVDIKDCNGNVNNFAVALPYLSFDIMANVFEIKAYSVNSKQNTTTQIPLNSCSLGDWTDINSVVRQQTLSILANTSFLCPVSTKDLFLNLTELSPENQYVKINIKYCSVATNPNCNQTTADVILNATGRSLRLITVILDVSINNKKQNPIQYQYNFIANTAISATQSSSTLIQFEKYNIQTDTSVMPWQQKKTIDGIKVQRISTDQYDLSTDVHNATLAEVTFTMTTTGLAIDRKKGKLDQVISYVGGLFSVIVVFVSFFLKSFNQYRYQLRVAEGAFVLDKSGKKINEEDFHFFSYIKYTIFDWVNLVFAKKLPWKDCLEIDDTREQMNNYLETQRVYRRIAILENGLKMMMNRDENQCLKLLAQQTLEEVRNERFTQDYYQEAIMERCPLTIQDIRKNNVFLEKRKNTELQPDNIITLNEILNPQNDEYKKDKSDSQQIVDLIDKPNMDIFKKVEIILEEYPALKEAALAIKISEEFQMYEENLAASFKKLEGPSKKKFEEKIPIILLYRLGKRLNIPKIEKKEQAPPAEQNKNEN